MPLQKTKFIWMDGEWKDWDNAKVHVLTHALHYGTGVFEGIRCYDTVKGPAIFRLKEHISRLYNSAKILRMEPKWTVMEFMEACKEGVRKNGLKACYLRPVIYRGYGEMGVNPFGSPVSAFIAIWPWAAYLGDDGLKNGIKVITSSFTRHFVNSVMTKAKITGAYINAVLAKMEAHEQGFVEAIMLDINGEVCEGTGENIFVVKDGEIKTVPLSSSILGGVTRDTVIRLARDLGYTLKEETITRDELYIADEVFFTGTAAEVTPVVEIDRRKIADGKVGQVTKNIQSKFFDIVNAGDSRYDKWLTHV
ncbi:MAG: branched-chain amino acid transaminase [Candidatus Aenigmarchaeota archaeon]|nr:branched-chain amino acid transaminase [Candidatus Aenigmarchaeota archaeon]